MEKSRHVWRSVAMTNSVAHNLSLAGQLQGARGADQPEFAAIMSVLAVS